jgi:uncharacterized protein
MGFGFMLLSFALMGVGFYLQYKLKVVFKKYADVRTLNGMTGADIAARMLADNGIQDVKIQSVEGQLTDHYNPFERTVNLSPDVYSGTSVTAAAIAAHECGHAVQHARGYAMLMLRSRLVPITNVASNMVQWIIGGSFILMMFAGVLGVWVLGIGILLFAVTTLFTFVTLPVEFDASRRGLEWLRTSNVTGLDHDKAKEILTWAGMTYVVAAVASLINLLYYIMIFMSRMRRS